MIKKLLYSLFLGLFVFQASGQSICGTRVDQAQVDLEATITDSINSVIELNQTINISLFVTEDSNGDSGFDPTAFNNALSKLNNAFERIKVIFNASAPNYISNYHFNSIKQGANEIDLISQFTTVNHINLYLVASLTDNLNSAVGAYTYFPAAAKDVIFITKDDLSGEVLIEQLAHFFNVYHTHETIFGAEHANGDNCASAGDLLCDTPADPNLDGSVSDCDYTASTTDDNGDYYMPTVNNYVSFSNSECKCFFSDGQYIRMLNGLVLFKSHLW